MEKRTPTDYIWLGTAIRFLRDAREGNRVHGSGFIIANIDELVALLAALEFTVSAAAVSTSDLSELRRELGELPETSDDGAPTRLTGAQAAALQVALDKLTATIYAECESQALFVARPKRYDVGRLLDKPAELFAPGVYDAMTEMAQHEFAAAGRAIAYELPTAGAFHLMRGTEAELRRMYAAIVKRNRIAEPWVWGALVAALRTRRTPPAAALLDQLDSIRRNFRNPTQHPDAVYDLHEAEDLLSECCVVVGRMQKSAGIT